MSERPNGLTYAQAGVSIDAGNELVERIKPLARSTRRSGSEPSLGGFGALFDLKAAGYDDPLLVTTTDGVGTKLKVAIETGIHTTVGIDLVGMCVNDLLAQGAEPLMFLDYYATGKLDVEAATAVVFVGAMAGEAAVRQDRPDFAVEIGDLFAAEAGSHPPPPAAPAPCQQSDHGLADAFDGPGGVAEWWAVGTLDHGEFQQQAGRCR